MSRLNASSVEDSVAQLERQVQRLRRTLTCVILIGCIGAGVLFLVGGAKRADAQATRRSRAETIRVEAVQLVNRDGMVVGEFGTEAGQPFLRIMDADGKDRIFLGMARVNSGDDGPMLMMSHGKEWLRLRGPSRYQHSELRLHGEDDKGAGEAELRVIGSAPALWLIKGEQRIWEAP